VQVSGMKQRRVAAPGSMPVAGRAAAGADGGGAYGNQGPGWRGMPSAMPSARALGPDAPWPDHRHSAYSAYAARHGLEQQQQHAWDTAMHDGARQEIASELPLTAAVRMHKLLVKFQTRVASSEHSPELRAAPAWTLFALETTSLYGQAQLKRRSKTSPADAYSLSHGRSEIEETASEETASSSTHIVVTDPVTGEISGMVLNLDLQPVECLCEIARAAQKAPAASPKLQAARNAKEREGRPSPRLHSKGVRGERGGRARQDLSTEKDGPEKQGVLPFPVLLHLQNIQVSLAAPFAWEQENPESKPESNSEEAAATGMHAAEGNGDARNGTQGRPARMEEESVQRGKSCLGKMTLVLVRAQLEGGAEAGSVLNVDLDAGGASDGQLLARPTLVLSYQEWRHVQACAMPVRVLDHTVFSIHRVWVQATPPHTVHVGDEHAREVGPQDMHQGGAGQECSPGLEFTTPVSPAHRRRAMRARQDLDSERETGRDVDWSSDEEEEARRPGRRQGRANFSEHHGHAVQHHAGDARIMVNGVRLNWEAPVQHSMLQVCLAHYAKVHQIKEREEAPQTPRPAGQFGREAEAMPDFSFAAPAAAAQNEVSATVSLEVHDVWLNFAVTKRAVLGIDIPHAVCSVTHLLCPHHPVQSRSQHAADSSLCGFEVRDLAVHRLRDQACNAPVLQGSLGQATYEADCESYAPRAPPNIPSDRFFSIEVLRAAVPVAALGMDSAGLSQAEAERLETSGQHTHVAHVEMVGVHVVVPMPPNISLHGRREGLRGPWFTQHRFVNDPIAYWTPLGVMVGDCLQVIKALQVLVQERIAAILPPASSPTPHQSVTELPSGLPDIDLHLSQFDVKLVDDSFEIWMGAFQRLHRDEAGQRLEREELLLEQLASQRAKGTPVSEEAEIQMWNELARLNAQLWQTRAAEFKRCEFFQAPPPLMSFEVQEVTGLFMPRAASWLEPKLADLVSFLPAPLSKTDNPHVPSTRPTHSGYKALAPGSRHAPRSLLAAVPHECAFLHAHILMLTAWLAVCRTNRA